MKKIVEINRLLFQRTESGKKFALFEASGEGYRSYAVAWGNCADALDAVLGENVEGSESGIRWQEPKVGDTVPLKVVCDYVEMLRREQPDITIVVPMRHAGQVWLFDNVIDEATDSVANALPELGRDVLAAGLGMSWDDANGLLWARYLWKTYERKKVVGDKAVRILQNKKAPRLRMYLETTPDDQYITNQYLFVVGAK